MAVEFSVAYTRRSVYFIAPEDIVVKPELNGRHDLPDIEWLIQSILQQGQLQPVLVRRDGDKPVLVAGFSRWRAVSEINKRGLAAETLKLRCDYFRGNEIQGIIANARENRDRNSTTELDDAHLMMRLERYGLTLGQIAEIYHVDVAKIRRVMSLAHLSPEAEQALRAGRIKPTAAQAIAKLSAEQQHAALVKSSGRVTAGDIAAASGKARQPSFGDVKAALKQITDREQNWPPWCGRLTHAERAAAGEFARMLLTWIEEKQEVTNG